MGFPRQEYWSRLHFFFQGIFLTQGSNLYLLWFMHWQVDSLPLSHFGFNLFLRKKGINCYFHFIDMNTEIYFLIFIEYR